MQDSDQNAPASPTCYWQADSGPGDDLAGWRRDQRARLLDARAALSQAARARIAEAIATHLDAALARHFGGSDWARGKVVSAYWPIKSEPDLRPWLTRLHAGGAQPALPVVATRASPLVFRPWTPDAPMRRGHWNILEPDTRRTVIPQIVLAPLVSWDGQGFRLGYGGGYFDRTLAALSPRPFVVGTGLQMARLESIHPQPHDIAMDVIVTEAGVQWESGTSL